MDEQNTSTSTSSAAAAKKAQADKRTWTEEIEVAGEELIANVKRLAAEGKVSRIRLIEPDGDIVLEMPLTIGAIAGGAVVIAAPLLAILGAVAAFVSKVRLEVVRNEAPPSEKAQMR